MSLRSFGSVKKFELFLRQQLLRDIRTFSSISNYHGKVEERPLRNQGICLNCKKRQILWTRRLLTTLSTDHIVQTKDKESDSGSKKSEEKDTENNGEESGGGPKDSTFFWLIPAVAVSSFLAINLGELFSLLWPGKPVEEIRWRQFVDEYLRQGKVKKVVVFEKDKVILGQLKRNSIPSRFAAEYDFRCNIPSVESFDKKLQEVEDELGVVSMSRLPVEYNHVMAAGVHFKTGSYTLKIINTLFYVGVTAAITILARRIVLYNSFLHPKTIKKLSSRESFKMDDIIKQASGMSSFSKDTAIMLEKNTGVTFKDVAGCEEAKIEIMEFVNFLKNKDQYEKLGAKIPKGALLTGPPGTGKTLLAKATAGEAGVPVIIASGSEFNEIFVGTGAARVRSLFEKARKNAPCILFIDEMDAIGRKRTAGSNANDQTLNAFLVELDGFKTEGGVIVLGATNRADVMDPALLRPGRFDRQIFVDLPDIKGRASIFKVHLKNIKLDLDKDEVAKKMAARTPQFSGADIANLCNEAALIAARNDASYVTVKHFEDAFERVIGGLEKKSQVLTPMEKKQIAYHEAGHAIAGWFLEYGEPLTKVTIIPRGKALGYALYQPKERFQHSKEMLLDLMCKALGGRVAEEIFFKNLTTGARSDFDQVTKVAYAQVMQLGMSEAIGPIAFEQRTEIQKPFSEKTHALIDEEVRKLVRHAYQRTMDLLTSHRDDIIKVAELLIEKEKIDHDDMIALLGKRPFEDQSTYEEIVAGRGSLEEDTELPEGLKDWNKPTNPEDKS